MDTAETLAKAEAWRYAHGFNEMRVLKLMVEIGVPELLEHHGSMTLSELSLATGCPEVALHRIMRYLSHIGIFKQYVSPITSVVTYAPTLISRYLTVDNLGMYMLVQSNPDILPYTIMSVEDLKAGRGSGLESTSPFDKIWSPEVNEKYRKAIRELFVNHSKAMAVGLVESVPETFQQIGSLVDVGGREGTALGILVKAFPWIRGTNFDLPHVISEAPSMDGVVHVGGDMFSNVPKSDAIMLMRVLHDWGDQACIDILKKCKEAIPTNTGKVIIVDTILNEDDEKERDELSGSRLLLDMTIMMATANGKERTTKEWAKLIEAAGFPRHTIKHMKAIESVIEAYP